MGETTGKIEMSQEELEKIKNQIIDELVERDVERVYDFEDEEYSQANWEFNNKIKEQFSRQLAEKTDKIISENEKVIKEAIKDLISDILPDIVYGYLEGVMNNHIQNILADQRNMAMQQSIDYVRNNLKI